MKMDLMGLTLCILLGAGGMAALSLAQPPATGSHAPASPATAAPATRPAGADDDETEIKLAEAPPAVRAAAAKLTAEKNITKVTRETDEGVTTFEVEYTENGVSNSAVFSGAGDLLETEHGITQQQLPAAALAAVQKKHPGTTLGTMHLVTKSYYEIEVVTNGKKREVRVNAAGEVDGGEHHEEAKGEHAETGDKGGGKGEHK